MNGGELPACSLEDWQTDMLSQMGTIRSQLADMQQQQTRIETQAIRTNGRVSGLEDRMEVADRERSSLSAQIDVIRSQAVPEIESAIERVLARRETDADAAAYRALKARFGDPEEGLGRWSALQRLLSSTASKAWLTMATLAAGAGAAAILERLF